MVGFTAQIHKLGINPAVDPPAGVLNEIFFQAQRSTNPIPVSGTINGERFLKTLVKYKGAWRLYINGPMLAAAGAKVGDSVEIEMAFDPAPRKVSIPEIFREALENNASAKKGFEELTPSRRKEILRYIGQLKTPAALERNVQKVIDRLLTEGKT
ncbi:MAG: YdeI/OmpD-associated family protein [Pyrinomonadaceae bacterium]